MPAGSESFRQSLRLLKLLAVLLLLPASLPAYERIVSLKPNLTEILFALGLGDKIVGVTTYCDYPPEAKKIDKVSDYLQPDIEKLVAKKPDLIITSEENSLRREIEYLQRKGYKILTYKTDTLDQLRETLRQLGRDVGKAEEGQKLAQGFEQQLQDLKKKAEALQSQNPNFKPWKALFIVGQHPLIVAGTGNLLNDVAPYLGLQNAVKESRLKYPSFSIEQVYAAAPELILDFSMGGEASPSSRAEARADLEKMKALPAIQNARLYFWDIGSLRASPRLPRELNKLFDAIHAAKPGSSS